MLSNSVKKITIIAAAIGALASQSAFATENLKGNIKFTGTIVPSTCKFNGGNQIQDVTVSMGEKVNARDFDQDGYSPKVSIPLAFSECDVSTKQVKLTIQNDGVDGLISLDQVDGVAQGTTVALFDKTGQPITAAYDSGDVDIDNNAADLSLQAAYKKGDGFAAGKANASVGFSVEYK